ncbi:hypothetical protein AMTRI_Chr11g158230 [Amborella trichopoda]
MDDEIMEVESASSKAKKIQWTHRMEIGLLDALVEQVEPCGKPEKDFKPPQWNSVEKSFTKATGMALRRENCKNRLKSWGKNYPTVIINHNRFGWDSVRQTVTGNEDWDQCIAISLFLSLLWYL